MRRFAGVGIGVEEAVAEDHVHPEHGTAAGEFVGGNRVARELVGLAETHAFEVLHGEHSAGAEFREGAGKTHGGVLREVLGELADVALLNV